MGQDTEVAQGTQVWVNRQLETAPELTVQQIEKISRIITTTDEYKREGPSAGVVRPAHSGGIHGVPRASDIPLWRL